MSHTVYNIPCDLRNPAHLTPHELGMEIHLLSQVIVRAEHDAANMRPTDYRTIAQRFHTSGLLSPLLQEVVNRSRAGNRTADILPEITGYVSASRATKATREFGMAQRLLGSPTSIDALIAPKRALSEPGIERAGVTLSF